MLDTLSAQELQPYEYKGFTIDRDKATMLLSIVRPETLPSRLLGRYTRESIVEEAIDRYLEDTKRIAKTNDKNNSQD